MLLAELRQTMARIEAGLGTSARPKARQGFNPAPRERPVESAEAGERFRLGDGTLPFDRVLGGGLKRGTLHEIVAAHRQDDGAAAGFAAALALRGAQSGPLVWIVEDRAAHETGLPYRPGLAAHGLDPDQLLLVRTRQAQATLWATEEALRARAPLVLTELWDAKPYGLTASRRLVLAAQAGRSTLLLLHIGLSGQAARLASAAETRLCVAAHPSPHLASAAHRLPIPGAAAFTVRLLKLRLGGAQSFDAERQHRLIWLPTQRCFHDHPLSVGVSTPVADRSADTPDGRRVAFRQAGAGR